MPKRFLTLASGTILPVAVIGLWEVAARSSWLTPSMSAPPSAIAATALELFRSGELPKHAVLSLARLLVGVAVGAFGGVAVGILAGQSRRMDRLVSPLLQFIAPVPVVVWIPFAIMLLGTGELYKISLAMLATFLLVYIHTFQGVRGVPGGYLELADMYEKGRWEGTRRVLLPAALPSVVTGLRIALAISWIAIFFVEYSSAEVGLGGLGWFIADARQVGRVEHQFAGVLLLGIVGYGTDAAVAAWQRRKLAWAATLETALAQRAA